MAISIGTFSNMYTVIGVIEPVLNLLMSGFSFIGPRTLPKLGAPCQSYIHIAKVL